MSHEPHEANETEPPVQPDRPERWTPAGPIRSFGMQDRLEELEFQTAATVADATPLGWAAFAAATFTVSAVNAGWAPILGLVSTVPVLLVFGGLVLFIAGMWAFRKGDTFQATAFGVLGAFNTLFAAAILMAAFGTIPLGTPAADIPLGITLATFGLIVLYLMVAAIGVSVVVTASLLFLTASYGLLAAAFILGPPNLVMVAGGYTGIVSALIAFYVSAAAVIDSVARQELLPY